MATSREKALAALKAAKREVKENPLGVAELAAAEEDPALAVDVARDFEKKMKEELEARRHEREQEEKTELEARRNAEEEREKKLEQARRNDGTMMGGLAMGQREPSQTKDSNSSAKFLWFVVVIVQAILAFQVMGVWDYLGFNINALVTFPILGPLYAMIALWAFIIFKGKGIIGPHDMPKLLSFLAISASYIIVISYMDYVPGFDVLGLPLRSWVSFIFFVMFPIWPIYIAKHAGDEQISRMNHIYVNSWILVLLFIAILYFATNLRASTLPGARPELVEASNVVDFLMQKTVDIGKNLWKSLNLVTNVNVLLNASGINYYTGMVDQNEKAPVGLYIENIRPQDRYTYVGSPAVIWADIRGKSFTSEINVNPYCYTEGVGKKRVDGVPFPNSIKLFGQETTSLRCTFNGLEKGTYSTKVGASFNFETWAYVTYTFVDQDLARAMDTEGRNINSELDIPRVPKAVYTNGPAFLGMGPRVDQPVRVEKDNPEKRTIIGVTLDNAWSEGNIERVNEFIMQVPDDFELLDCDRWLPDKQRPPFETKDGYNYFKFSREELADPRVDFSSLTCTLKIKDAAQFMVGQQKVQRTFATQVKYDYAMQKSTSITVRE